METEMILQEVLEQIDLQEEMNDRQLKECIEEKVWKYAKEHLLLINCILQSI